MGDSIEEGSFDCSEINLNYIIWIVLIQQQKILLYTEISIIAGYKLLNIFLFIVDNK